MNRYFDSYGSDPRRIQYAGSETDGFFVDYKVIEFSLAKLQLITPKRISTSKRFLRHSQIFEQLFVLINTKEVFWNIQALKYR